MLLCIPHAARRIRHQIIQKKVSIYVHGIKYNSELNGLKQKIVYYRYHKVKICTKIYDKIEALEDEQEKRKLKYRYIRCCRWEEIADMMGYRNSKAIRTIIY